jgi:hypothetical protein
MPPTSATASAASRVLGTTITAPGKMDEPPRDRAEEHGAERSVGARAHDEEVEVGRRRGQREHRIPLQLDALGRRTREGALEVLAGAALLHLVVRRRHADMEHAQGRAGARRQVHGEADRVVGLGRHSVGDADRAAGRRDEPLRRHDHGSGAAVQEQLACGADAHRAVGAGTA